MSDQGGVVDCRVVWPWSVAVLSIQIVTAARKEHGNPSVEVESDPPLIHVDSVAIILRRQSRKRDEIIAVRGAQLRGVGDPLGPNTVPSVSGTESNGDIAVTCDKDHRPFLLFAQLLVPIALLVVLEKRAAQW